MHSEYVSKFSLVFFVIKKVRHLYAVFRVSLTVAMLV
jgi:hypothetical protein